ncbi:MAG: hypothetical protein QGH93_10780 [Gammaproteobacteria bacterium]|jgi:hypothetical protein|nr:hypothetical protein [Gammaproteobacteria bacterium]
MRKIKLIHTKKINPPKQVSDDKLLKVVTLLFTSSSQIALDYNRKAKRRLAQATHFHRFGHSPDT